MLQLPSFSRLPQLQALQACHEGALAGAGVSEQVMANAARHVGFGYQFVCPEGLVGIAHAHEHIQPRCRAHAGTRRHQLFCSPIRRGVRRRRRRHGSKDAKVLTFGSLKRPQHTNTCNQRKRIDDNTQLNTSQTPFVLVTPTPFLIITGETYTCPSSNRAPHSQL